MNTRYHAALRLAEVILRNSSAEAGEGRHQTASFVVDMGKVFEDFVGAALRQAMTAFPGEMRLQFDAMLNEAVRDSDRLTVRPDAVHLLGGGPWWCTMRSTGPVRTMAHRCRRTISRCWPTAPHFACPQPG